MSEELRQTERKQCGLSPLQYEAHGFYLFATIPIKDVNYMEKCQEMNGISLPFIERQK